MLCELLGACRNEAWWSPLGTVEKPGYRSPSLGLGLGLIWGQGSSYTRAPSPYCAHTLPGELVEMQLLIERFAVGPEI